MRWIYCRECKNPYPADEEARENDRINPPDFLCSCDREKSTKVHAHYIQPDITPYKNIIDGGIISSRREHKEFLKRNNVRENPDPPPALKERLYEAKHGAKHG